MFLCTRDEIEYVFDMYLKKGYQGREIKCKMFNEISLIAEWRYSGEMQLIEHILPWKHSIWRLLRTDSQTHVHQIQCMFTSPVIHTSATT